MNRTPRPDHRPATPRRPSRPLAALAACVLVAALLAASGASGPASAQNNPARGALPGGGAQNPAQGALSGSGVQSLLGGARQGFTPTAGSPGGGTSGGGTSGGGSSGGKTCALDLGGATLGSPGYDRALDLASGGYADCVLGSTRDVVSDPGKHLENPGYDGSRGANVDTLLGAQNPPGEGLSGGFRQPAGGSSGTDPGSGGGVLPDRPDPGTEGLVEDFLGVDPGDDSEDSGASDGGGLTTYPSPGGGNHATGPPSGGGGGSSGSSGSSGEAIYQEALSYQGTPYVLGGPAACIPGRQMDCSCLTLTVYGEFGYSLPDLPQAQASYGSPVNTEPAVGNLIVYADPGDGTGGHVAIGDGSGGVFHCASPALGCTTGPDYTTAGATPVSAIREL